MKSMMILFLCGALPLAAQYPVQVTENQYALPANKKVELNLKFAREIVATTWNRSEIGLKTKIAYSKAELLKIHRMQVQESAEALRIMTDYDFDEYRRDNQCWNCGDNPAQGDRDCICLQVSYEIMLPADAALTLETISGDIEIRGLSGPLRIKTISGFVDLGLTARARSDLSFRSVTGEIYTDFDLKLDGSSSSYSKKLTVPLNGGGSAISLETVSGNIYFRKL